MIDGGECRRAGVLLRRREFVVFEQRQSRRRLQWGDRMDPRGKAERAYPSTRGHRECLFRVSAELGRPKPVRGRRKRLLADFFVQLDRNGQCARLPYCRYDQVQAPRKSGTGYRARVSTSWRPGRQGRDIRRSPSCNCSLLTRATAASSRVAPTAWSAQAAMTWDAIMGGVRTRCSGAAPSYVQGSGGC